MKKLSDKEIISLLERIVGASESGAETADLQELVHILTIGGGARRVAGLLTEQSRPRQRLVDRETAGRLA